MKYYRFKESSDSVAIGKLVCLARTYSKHAAEMKARVTKDPLLFLKPASSVIFNGDTVVIPRQSTCLHHEVELGVIIGKTAKKISSKGALDYVRGYLVGLDITARDLQSEAKKQGCPWSIAKGFDTFAPLSDAINAEVAPDPNNLDLSLHVNGSIRQHANTRNMIYSVEDILAYVSSIMTLEPGDLIMTGTPEGVGEIHHRDLLEARLADLCMLTVDVKNE
jgi:acylpyruvate hydrolase